MTHPPRLTLGSDHEFPKELAMATEVLPTPLPPHLPWQLIEAAVGGPWQRFIQLGPGTAAWGGKCSHRQLERGQTGSGCSCSQRSRFSPTAPVCKSATQETQAEQQFSSYR